MGKGGEGTMAETETDEKGRPTSAGSGNYYTTGERILLLRHQRRPKMTVGQLAGILGVSPRTVARYERDEVLPSGDALIRMSEVFGVSVDYLLRLKASRKLDIRCSLTERPKRRIRAAQVKQRALWPASVG
jgi:transcriptional regulator with XRE-family HTH domain